MKLITFLLLLSFSFSPLSNKKSSQTEGKKGDSFIQFQHFELREKPILNREYIVFLCWYMDVYGFSYPDKVFEILPKNSLTSIPDCSNSFEPLFENLKPNALLKNYILNPKYLDYPLIGLTEYQVMELANWMSDRYNEFRLIKNKTLLFNPLQMDEDCFTTEALLAGQYMGSVRKENNYAWKKNRFKSTFRLPYSSELKNSSEKYSTKLIEYPFNSKDFLWIWENHYLSASTENLSLHFQNQSIQIADGKEPQGIFNMDYTNAQLKNKANHFANSEYLITDFPDDYPYQEKAFDGKMNFRIAGTNDKYQPIIVDKFKADKNLELTNKIYRIVSDQVIEKKYWPSNK